MAKEGVKINDNAGALKLYKIIFLSFKFQKYRNEVLF